jgi:hypothetical protein
MEEFINVIDPNEIEELIVVTKSTTEVKLVEIVGIFALFVSVIGLFLTLRLHQRTNRAYVTIEFYCMDETVYITAKNIGNLDAYNIEIIIDGLLGKEEPFKCISMINRGTTFRSSLMRKNNLKDYDEKNIKCTVRYNDLYKKKKKYHHTFSLPMVKNISTSIEYNEKLDVFDIKV